MLTDDRDLRRAEHGEKRVEPRRALLVFLVKVYGEESISIINYVLDKSDYLTLGLNEIEEFRLNDEITPRVSKFFEQVRKLSEEDEARFSSSLADASVAKGLIAHYPLKENAKDLSPHQNHAQATKVAYRVCEGRHAAFLNGRSSYIRARHIRFHVVKNYTISAWVYLKAFESRGRIIEKGNGNSYYLYVFDKHPWFGFHDGRLYHDCKSPIVLQLKTWRFVVGTFDGKFLRLYIDGKCVRIVEVQKPVSPGRSSEPLFIGWKYEGIEIDHFNGMISDVRIYSRELTLQEIRILYNVAARPASGTQPAGAVA